MKIMGIVGGIGIAWAINHWLASFFPSLLGVSGIAAAFSGIAVILTATWAYVLNRLTIFEKLDDLTAVQKSLILEKAESFRSIVIFSMKVNSLILVLSVVLITLSGVPSLKSFSGLYIGYWICPSLLYLFFSFLESWTCYREVDRSRLVMADIQAANKIRDAYIKKIREDERDDPVLHNDAHLNSYTKGQ